MKSKTLLIAVLFGLFSSNFCSAQAALLVLIFGDKVATEDFHLSINAGYNVSTLPGLEQGSSSGGINFGLGTYIKLNEKWALTPEFLALSPRGAKSVESILPYDIALQNPETDFNFKYIDVPILARYNVSKTFFISAGPQISFLTSAKQVTTGTSSVGSEEISQSMKSEMNKYTLSIPFELGYTLSHFRTGKGVELKVRYDYGISDAFDSDLASSRNSTFQFILAFPFVNATKTNK